MASGAVVEVEQLAGGVLVVGVGLKGLLQRPHGDEEVAAVGAFDGEAGPGEGVERLGVVADPLVVLAEQAEGFAVVVLLIGFEALGSPLPGLGVALLLAIGVEPGDPHDGDGDGGEQDEQASAGSGADPQESHSLCSLRLSSTRTVPRMMRRSSQNEAFSTYSMS